MEGISWTNRLGMKEVLHRCGEKECPTFNKRKKGQLD
jgi:hypothetical protein